MKRLVLGLVALVVGLTAVVGIAHTEMGRPLLAYMPWGNAIKGVCPLGYDAPKTAHARAAAERQFATLHRGEFPAAARPALGFKLQSATASDVQTWAKAKGVTCREPRSGHDLECVQVPARALPAPDDGTAVQSLWLDFGPDKTLTSVIALRRHKQAGPIAATFANINATLAEAAGQPSQQSGQGSVSELQKGLLRQASVEYRFSDYYALTRATNMAGGFLLTEEYHALN